MDGLSVRAGTRADGMWYNYRNIGQRFKAQRGSPAPASRKPRRIAMPAPPELLQRITTCPEVFGGKPIIRDLRISVEPILILLS